MTEHKHTPGDSYEYYIDQYKIMHNGKYTKLLESSPTYRSREILKPIIVQTGCKSLLDFGCAAGLHWTEYDLKGFFELDEFGLYDPAVEAYKTLPERTFDGVLCVDVMEHIPEDSVDYVIEQILSRATKLALFKIAVAPAMAILPDGQNAHVTVKSSEWWRNRIAEHKKEGLTIQVNRVII